jgi:hypothetical protein
LHLTLESIIELLEGRSEDKHADQCPECRGRVEEWRLLHSRLHRTQLVDAPVTVLKAAYGIPGPQNGIGQALASLIFDSFSQPAFAGARGSGESRQLVLRSAEIDVHIRISGKPENRQIMGQVLTRSETGSIDTAKVHLVRDGKRIQSAELDPLGEFEFKNSPAGLLSLQIDLPSLTVTGPLGSEDVA